MASDEKRRRRQRGRRGEHSYMGIPHYIVRSAEFGALEPWPLKLLIELAANFNGSNNGDLSAAYSALQKRGWNSPGTLSRAIKKLLCDGWLITTRHGGRNRCALFAVTWLPVDACEGRWLEVRAETAPSHKWRKTVSVVQNGIPVVPTCSSEIMERAA